MEWRYVHGFFLDPGPATAWTRLRVPIVPDEQPGLATSILSDAQGPVARGAQTLLVARRP